MITLRPAPNSFIPLPTVSDWLCTLSWPGEAEAWLATVRLHVEQHQTPPETLEMGFYEAAYTIWRLVLNEGLQLYRIDAVTFRYEKVDPAYFRQAAHALAESARHLGAFGCAAWLEAKRRFDRKFFRQVRWEEVLTGLEIEGTLNYLAELYVRSVDVLALLPVPSSEGLLTLLNPAPPPTTGHSDKVPPRQAAEVGHTMTRNPRKHIYELAQQLLEKDPNLDNHSLITQLKQRQVSLRGTKLSVTRPDGRSEQVNRDAFDRTIRKIRSNLRSPRKYAGTGTHQ